MKDGRALGRVSWAEAMAWEESKFGTLGELKVDEWGWNAVLEVREWLEEAVLHRGLLDHRGP